MKVSTAELARITFLYAFAARNKSRGGEFQADFGAAAFFTTARSCSAVTAGGNPK